MEKHNLGVKRLGCEWGSLMSLQSHGPGAFQGRQQSGKPRDDGEGHMRAGAECIQRTPRGLSCADLARCHSSGISGKDSLPRFAYLGVCAIYKQLEKAWKAVCGKLADLAKHGQFCEHSLHERGPERSHKQTHSPVFKSCS